MRSALCYIIIRAILVDVAWSIPHKLCRNNGTDNANCEKMFVWRNNRDNFVSVLGASYPRPETDMLASLQNKTINILCHNMMPYLWSNGSEYFTGFLGDIWTLVQEILQFKSSVKTVDYDTGLEMISNGKADIFLAAGVVKDGLKNVAFSQPYFENWYNLYVKRPPARASATSYVKTLSEELWYASLIMFGILTLCLWLTTWFLHNIYKNEPRISLPSSILTIAVGFLNQGFDIGVSSFSARIQITSALLLGYMLYSAVNAVLVAKLAVFEIELPFNSLNDIQKQRGYSLCLRTNTFVYNAFIHQKNRTITAKWKGILNGPGCLDIINQTNLARIVCQDRIIILENRIVMGTVLKEFKVPCDVANLDAQYFPKGNVYLISKLFEQRHAIEYALLKLKNAGVLRRLEEKWVQRKRIINNLVIEEPQATREHISGIMTLYGTMMFISLIILLLEISFSYYRNIRKKKPKHYTP